MKALLYLFIIILPLACSSNTNNKADYDSYAGELEEMRHEFKLDVRCSSCKTEYDVISYNYRLPIERLTKKQEGEQNE